MRLKGMEDLAAISVKEVRRAAAEKRDEDYSAEGRESQNTSQNHPSELSES